MHQIRPDTFPDTPAVNRIYEKARERFLEGTPCLVRSDGSYMPNFPFYAALDVMLGIDNEYGGELERAVNEIRFHTGYPLITQREWDGEEEFAAGANFRRCGIKDSRARTDVAQFVSDSMIREDQEIAREYKKRARREYRLMRRRRTWTITLKTKRRTRAWKI